MDCYKTSELNKPLQSKKALPFGKALVKFYNYILGIFKELRHIIIPNCVR